MSKLINVTIGRSTVEGLEFGNGIMAFKATIYGAKLVGNSSFARITGYRDEACSVKANFRLVGAKHPRFGDILRAKLAAKPFRSGATLELSLVVIEEWNGKYEGHDGKEYSKFEWMLCVVDANVVTDGEGEVCVLKAKAEKSEKTESSEKGEKKVSMGNGTYGPDLD